MIPRELLQELYYNRLFSVLEIAKTLGCSKAQVLYWMDKYDLGRRSFSEADKLRSCRPVSSLQIDEMIQRYLAGETQETMARAYGLAWETIKEVLISNGVILRNRSEANRRYTLDEAAFDTITTESAYWIGLLMADGNIYQHPDSGSLTITLTLHHSDYAHLERFQSFLGSSRPITTNAQGISRVSVTSERLAHALMRYGVVPRKTLTARVVGLENNVDFWRGVIDGDGHLRLATPLRVNLHGSRLLMKQFAAFVHTYFLSCKATVRAVGKTASVTVYSNYAVGLAKLLYYSGAVALPRKLAIANAIMANTFRPEV